MFRFSFLFFVKLKGLTTITQVLLRWCDKTSEIFNTLCTVLYVFSLTPKFNQVINTLFNVRSYETQNIFCFFQTIRNVLSTQPQATYIFNEIKRRIIRRENMEMNKVENSSSTRSLAIGKIQQYHELPNRRSDFGLMSSKPYIFSSSIFALNTVLNELQIE